MEKNNFIIKPFVGVGIITFSMGKNQLIDLLKNNNIHYSIEVWANKGCTPEVAWDIIRVNKRVSFYYAKNKMFKIYFENDFDGALDNGIKLGMPIDKALEIDDTLRYNDDEEDYESSNGYWIEDNIDTKTVESITIFIKEVLNDKLFFTYEWALK